jgi:hypothetical protein
MTDNKKMEFRARAEELIGIRIPALISKAKAAGQVYERLNGNYSQPLFAFEMNGKIEKWLSGFMRSVDLNGRDFSDRTRDSYILKCIRNAFLDLSGIAEECDESNATHCINMNALSAFNSDGESDNDEESEADRGIVEQLTRLLSDEAPDEIMANEEIRPLICQALQDLLDRKQITGKDRLIYTVADIGRADGEIVVEGIHYSLRTYDEVRSFLSTICGIQITAENVKKKVLRTREKLRTDPELASAFYSQ